MHHDHNPLVEACQRALSETGHKRAERMLDMVAMVSRFSWDRSAQCVVEALQDLGIDPQRRAETLSVEDFVAMARILSSSRP